MVPRGGPLINSSYLRASERLRAHQRGGRIMPAWEAVEELAIEYLARLLMLLSRLEELRATEIWRLLDRVEKAAFQLINEHRKSRKWSCECRSRRKSSRR